MNRALTLVLLLAAAAGGRAWAQDEEQDRVGIAVQGYAGVGTGQTFASNQNGSGTNTLDHFTDLGLTAKGYLYDPRLVGFYGTVDNGLSSAGGSDLASYSTQDWNYYGGLNFFSERSFPFTIFASRSNANTYSSLFPSVNNIMSSWGLNGSWFNNPVGRMGYSFTQSSTDQQAPGLPDTHTHYLHGAYTLTRKLEQWDMRFSDDYFRIVNPFFFETNGTTANEQTVSDINTIQGSAVRQFGESKRLTLQAVDSKSDTTEPGSSPSDSTSTYFSADYSWRMTEKLSTSYGGFYQRDHVSAINVINTIGGTGSTTIPSLDDSVTAGDVHASYRASDHLSLLAGVDYFHNNYGNQEVQAGQSDQNAEDLLTTRAGYSYQWDFSKLHWSNSGQLIWQHYQLVSGGTDSAVGYEVRQGVDGGRSSTLKYHFGGRFVDQANPVFFQYVRTKTEAAEVMLNSSRFSRVHLGMNGNLVFNQYDLATGTQTGKSETAGLNADFPTKGVGLFGIYSHSNGIQRFFNSLPGSPGSGSSGGPPQFPSTLLNAYDLTRFGATWSRHNTLRVASYYNRIKYAFAFTNTTVTTDTSWDSLVEYLFGRFTIDGGYSRGLYEVQPTHTNLNRWFVRVRFPFHIWQRG